MIRSYTLEFDTIPFKYKYNWLKDKKKILLSIIRAFIGHLVQIL